MNFDTADWIDEADADVERWSSLTVYWFIVIVNVVKVDDCIRSL